MAKKMRTKSGPWQNPCQFEPNILRVTAPNASPFTLHGTNTYIVGSNELAIIDPGPDDSEHLQTLLAHIAGRPVSAILLTHTHRDHSPLTQKLKAATGAKTYATGPHKTYRPLNDEENIILGDIADIDFKPDVTVINGQRIAGSNWVFETIPTPGHTFNHACFGLTGSNVLFSGDHVMGWSTTVVMPPDGSMADYMKSLDVVFSADYSTYLPGHGDVITEAKAYVSGVKSHRLMRERAILDQLSKGAVGIEAIVDQLYKSTPIKLKRAAGLTVYSHLEKLVQEKRANCTDVIPVLRSQYFQIDLDLPTKL